MKFRDFHVNIKVRIFELFASRLVGNMVLPFMSIYLADHFGTKITGLLILINVFTGITMSLLSGYIADQYGRRNVMITAESLRLCSFFIMTVSNSPWFESYGLTFIAMCMNSVCWGLAGPANQAMLIDVSTPDQRKTIYSIMYWANNISMSIGGIIGAFFFKRYLFQLFLILTLMTAIILIVIFLFIKETHKPSKSTATPKMTPRKHILEVYYTYKKVVQDRLFISFLTAAVLLLSLENQLTNYIGIKLDKHMPIQDFLLWKIDGSTMMGLLRSENTILVALIALFSAKLTQKYKDKNILVVNCFIYTIGFSGIAFSNNIWVLFIMMALHTLGEVLLAPVQESYMATIPPENARGAYLAFYNLQYDLCMIIVGITVSLSGFLSPFVMAWILTVIGLLGTFIFYFITPKLDILKDKAIKEEMRI
ncbi:MDR family MFS transporter [Heyndrickxia coagulans]|uniref:MDR family MFS transporter n=1 Tax=Heyndrickxia coagulans TaxID=1398 RepID=UPI000CE29A56|nr:MFS transporter [Heyndrickxia coagulans]AVD54879.1 MFS transporter [Heyndrickxia coagulans]